MAIMGFSGYDNWLTTAPEGPDLTDCFWPLERAVEKLAGTEVEDEARTLLAEAQEHNWSKAEAALTRTCEEEIPAGLVEAYWELFDLLNECRQDVENALYGPEEDADQYEDDRYGF